MKKELLYYLSVLLLVLLVACSKEEPAVESISLSESLLTLKEGDESTIVVSHHPESLPAPTYVWKSSNDNVVVVNQGHIKAINEGTAIISCEVTELGLSVSCKVIVEQVVPESISISKEIHNILVRETISLVATILPEKAKDKTVIWKSSNTAVATVDASGKVTGVSPGNVDIIATTKTGNARDSISIEVRKIPIEMIALNHSQISLYQGEQENLIVSLTPSDATYQDVIWKSDNNEIATINDEGVITAIKAGHTKIIVTSVDENKSASCDVEVKNNNVIEYNPFGDDIYW